MYPGCKLGFRVIEGCEIDPVLVANAVPNQATLTDFVLDGDVDLADFAGFQRCFSGADVSFTLPACAVFDSDCDEDVDLIDLKSAETRFRGP